MENGLYMKRKSLAGTCEIPLESQRVYVDVDYEMCGGVIAGDTFRPTRIHWPDGRYWDIVSIYDKREFGRSIFGNLCVRWGVCIGRTRKELWWEHGDFFVAKRSGLAARPE